MKHARPSPRKLGIGAAFGLAAFALLYGVGVNLLLSTGGLARLLSARPRKLRVEYAHARTLWPGRVHVEGLDVRGRSARLEWELHIDSADADIALFALFGRRLHVASVVATGVSFRARFRLEAKDVTDDRIARIPTIAGLDPVPLLNPEEDAIDGPAEPGERKPFTVQLENVDARQVREVWIDSFRLTGDMTAAGGFQLGPYHRLEVTPSRMHVAGATLAVGDDAIFRNLRGAADATLAPFDLGETKGVKVLRWLTSRSAFEANVGGLHFLHHFFEGKKIDLDGGEGSFDGLLVLERGMVKTGSRSHVELGPAHLTVTDRSFDASSIVDLAAGEDDAGGWATGKIALSSFAFTEPGAAHPVLTSPSMSLSARLPEVDLAEPPHDFAYACDAPRVEVADLGSIDAVLPKDGPFHIDTGKATVGVRAHGSLKEATADATVASSMSVRLDGAAAATAIDAKVHARADFEVGTLDLSGTDLELKGLSIRGAPAPAEWRGNVELASAEIRVSPPTFTATLTTSAHDARPLLSLYSAMRHTSPPVTTALALMPDPLIESMTANLHGGLRVVASIGSLELHGLDVRGADTQIRGEFVKHGERKTGGLVLVAGPASAGVSFDGEKTSVVLIGATQWFDNDVARTKSK